jgi:hypothetical protein
MKAGHRRCPLCRSTACACDRAARADAAHRALIAALDLLEVQVAEIATHLHDSDPPKEKPCPST